MSCKPYPPNPLGASVAYERLREEARENKRFPHQRFVRSDWGNAWVNTQNAPWQPIGPPGRFLSLTRAVNAYVWCRAKGTGDSDCFKLWLKTPLEVDPTREYEWLPGATGPEQLDTRLFPVAHEDLLRNPVTGAGGDDLGGGGAGPGGVITALSRDCELVRSDSPIHVGESYLSILLASGAGGGGHVFGRFLQVLTDGFDGLSFRIVNNTGGAVAAVVTLHERVRGDSDADPTIPIPGAARNADDVSLVIPAANATFVTYGTRSLGAGGIHLPHVPQCLDLQVDTNGLNNVLLEMVGRVQ